MTGVDFVGHLSIVIGTRDLAVYCDRSLLSLDLLGRTVRSYHPHQENSFRVETSIAVFAAWHAGPLRIKQNPSLGCESGLYIVASYVVEDIHIRNDKQLRFSVRCMFSWTSRNDLSLYWLTI